MQMLFHKQTAASAAMQSAGTVQFVFILLLANSELYGFDDRNFTSEFQEHGPRDAISALSHRVQSAVPEQAQALLTR